MTLFQNPSNSKQIVKQLKQIFNYLMIGMYLALGFFLLIRGWFALSRTQSLCIGILLIVYALFRVFRVLKESRNESDDEVISEK